MSNQLFSKRGEKYKGGYVSRHLAADLSTDTAVNTNIAYDAVDSDTLTDALSYNAGVFTALRPVRLMVSAHTFYQPNVTGLRCTYVSINNEFDEVQKPCVSSVSGILTTGICVCQQVSMNAGDTLIIRSFQSSGGALNLQGKTGHADQYSRVVICEI